jgi:adenylate cyclase
MNVTTLIIVIEFFFASAATVALAAIGYAYWAGRRRTVAPQRTSTFLFADLVGYSALTERCGDVAGARVAGEFARAMTRLSREHGARYVKSIGDAAMISAPTPAQAVALAVRAVEEVGTRPDLLPLRVGVHTGSAVQVGDDWYGHAVNVAARLVDEARPNEGLVSRVTQAAAAEEQQSLLTRRGELTFRGLAQPVEVWRLESRSRSRHAQARTVGLRGARPCKADPSRPAIAAVRRERAAA